MKVRAKYRKSIHPDAFMHVNPEKVHNCTLLLMS